MNILQPVTRVAARLAVRANRRLNVVSTDPFYGQADIRLDQLAAEQARLAAARKADRS